MRIAGVGRVLDAWEYLVGKLLGGLGESDIGVCDIEDMFAFEIALDRQAESLSAVTGVDVAEPAVSYVSPLSNKVGMELDHSLP